jgi:hypothetical protein
MEHNSLNWGSKVVVIVRRKRSRCFSCFSFSFGRATVPLSFSFEGIPMLWSSIADLGDGQQNLLVQVLGTHRSLLDIMLMMFWSLGLCLLIKVRAIAEPAKRPDESRIWRSSPVYTTPPKTWMSPSIRSMVVAYSVKACSQYGNGRYSLMLRVV